MELKLVSQVAAFEKLSFMQHVQARKETERTDISVLLQSQHRLCSAVGQYVYTLGYSVFHIKYLQMTPLNRVKIYEKTHLGS